MSLSFGQLPAPFLAPCQRFYLWAAAPPTMWRLFGGSEVITEGTCQCSNCSLYTKGHFKKKKKKKKWPEGSQPVVMFQGLDEGRFALECKMHLGSWQKGEVEGREGISLWNFEVRVSFVLGLCWFYGIRHIYQVNFYYIYQRAHWSPMWGQVSSPEKAQQKSSTSWKSLDLVPWQNIHLLYESLHVISSFALRVFSCYVISTWFYLLCFSCTVVSFSFSLPPQTRGIQTRLHCRCVHSPVYLIPWSSDLSPWSPLPLLVVTTPFVCSFACGG